MTAKRGEEGGEGGQGEEGEEGEGEGGKTAHIKSNNPPDRWGKIAKKLKNLNKRSIFFVETYDFFNSCLISFSNLIKNRKFGESLKLSNYCLLSF